MHYVDCIIVGGAKLVSLNEKQRGFPTGLRVMSSDRHQCCVFELKSSLDEARLHEGDWLKVESVEVWGCGGTQAAEMQQRIKEWEAKEVIRRREVSTYHIIGLSLICHLLYQLAIFTYRFILCNCMSVVDSLVPRPSSLGGRKERRKLILRKRKAWYNLSREPHAG